MRAGARMRKSWFQVAALVGCAGCSGGSGGADHDGAVLNHGDGGTIVHGAVARDTPAADAGAVSTWVRVHYDTGSGHRIALRGDGLGLTWSAGRDCTWTEGNVWQCELEGAGAPFSLKPLVDDVTWARGSNWQTTPGATLDLYPHFFTTTGRLE